MIGIKEFYNKALPSQGIYCIATIDSGEDAKVRHKFVESLDDIEPEIEKLKLKNTNIFVALSSFKGHSRKKDEALWVKSLYIDLDVGETKDYKTKEEAETSLNKFLSDTQLPPPVWVDSGRGIHAYWIFDRDIPAEEWKLYASKFKDYCFEKGLLIDPACTSELARIMRTPNTLNYKSNPPLPTKVISDTLTIYSFDEFKEFLGHIEPSIDDILKAAKKGLTEEEKQLNKNISYDFTKIVQRSFNGDGCAHIAYILENAKHLSEPLWHSGLTIAANCDDWENDIHKMSEDYVGYTREATIAKVNLIAPGKDTRKAFYSCDKINELNPGICEGCKYRGKIGTPLNLGRTLLTAITPKDSSFIESNQVVETTSQAPTTYKSGLTSLPTELHPYVYGVHGGIYYHPPLTFDDDGKPLPQKDPILVSKYDIYPTKRIYSPVDGECLLMKAMLPNDPEREFLMPMKYVYATEKFKEIITSVGIFPDPNTKQGAHLMNYIINWGRYLLTNKPAEIMRMQMGWTPDRESFVVGEEELTRDKKSMSSPTSPLCKGIAKHLMPKGSYDVWKESANKLNTKGLEIHAFVLMSGFGSVLMDYTSTSGVTISLTGESGAAKTGALYSALSVWGNPKDLSVLEATANGMTGRYLGLRNIPFGLDEVGNMHAKEVSQLIHKISQGKSKIRMQASVNAERDHEMSASLIAIFTSNHSLYDKLTTIKKDPNGEVARLIEIAARKPDLFKDDASLGREIFDKFRFNYGWAGREFMFALYDYTDSQIADMMDKWSIRFTKDFGEDTAYRFYENLISAVMTAGEIAVKADIISYDLDRIYKKIVSEMINIRDNVVKVNNVDYISLVAEFINNSQTGILALKGGNTTMEPRTSLVIRAELDDKRIFLEKPAFRKFLIDNNVSTREFLFQMKQTGHEVKELKKRMGTGWKDATGTLPVMAYELSLDNFNEVDDIIAKVIPE